MKRTLIAIAAAGALAACAPLDATLDQINARTTAFLTTCEKLDGREFTVALDVTAAEVGVTGAVETIRAKRERACALAGGVAILTAPVIPVP